MKLKSKLMMFTAAVAFSAGMAQAAISANDVVKSFQDAAYTHIEVVEGPTQIKVEAIKDGVKIEVIYDKISGAAIKTEHRRVTGLDSDSSGVEVTTSDSDFGDDHGGDSTGSDDGAGHDVGDDHGGDGSVSDDSEDSGDNSGSDDSDDSGDDNSGSDDSDDSDDDNDDRDDN